MILLIKSLKKIKLTSLALELKLLFFIEKLKYSSSYMSTSKSKFVFIDLSI